MYHSANMSTKKFIRSETQGHTLTFPNYSSLDNSTIERIFSNYGRVLSVTATGDARGYRFIRYATLEEAQRAADNVGNDYNIKLKIPNKNNRKKNNNMDESAKSSIPVWDNEVENYSDNSSCGEFAFNETRNTLLCSNQRTSSMNSLASSECSSSRLRSAVSEERVNQRYHELNNLRQQVFSPSNSECVPALVSSNHLEKQKVVVTAGEVVVGNIPTRLGAAYLLHLFEKHHPIAISYLQAVPRTNTNYCHVYFRSDTDAMRVEREFDKHSLMDTRLVVMRPEKLMKVGAA